ncbi:holo-ACP synthase [Lentisphaera profundi]|uniref:Holo-[acyl-carrier-protein] synthase n=1 Tax=Lentisphaera profundi TaxID=1658616 RepID=A0ABY7VS06_9BACT|nr:holo-ACP synthase [Lentisphaera profundi]WDE96827.1 holo-ACP synthase [Lentisphaera profundi]
MIGGVGTDICELARIQKLLESNKRQHFLDKTFTDEELDLAPGSKAEVAFYAGRWAAKEALAKALGTGFGQFCRWSEITVARKDSGAPYFKISGVTAETADSLGLTNFHLSISHEKSHAIAFVIAEKL